MKKTVHRLKLNVFKIVVKILNVFETVHVTFQAVLNDVHVTKNVMTDVHVHLKTITAAFNVEYDCKESTDGKTHETYYH